MIQLEARGGSAQARDQNMKNLQPCLCEDRSKWMDQNYGLLNTTEQSRFSKQHTSYKCVAPHENNCATQVYAENNKYV